jgi:starch synthase
MSIFSRLLNQNTQSNVSNSVPPPQQPSRSPEQTDSGILGFFQGITLFPESQTQKNSKYYRSRVEKLTTKAELISQNLSSLRSLTGNLKNPQVPDALLYDEIIRVIPQHLKLTLVKCLSLAFSSNSLEYLCQNPRALLQMKDFQGRTILEHYIEQQEQILNETKELAGLYSQLLSPSLLSTQEPPILSKIQQIEFSEKIPSKFKLSYTLQEGIKHGDTPEASYDILKLQQLQDFYLFLNSPEYSKEFIFEKFQKMDREIKTALGEAIWAACYCPNKSLFADGFIASNPRILLECKNSEKTDAIIQLIDHYKAKITLQRYKQEILNFMKQLRRTTDTHQQLQLFRQLPQCVQNDLSNLLWLEHGGRENPSFGYWRYGELQIEANPSVLLQTLPSTEHRLTTMHLYLKQIDQKIEFNICTGAHQFTAERQIPEGPVDCSALQLSHLKDTIPPHLKVAMVAAEFAGVVSMGGLAPAVSGMARAYGTEDVCVILPKYDVINSKLVLKEKEKYQLELNGEKHQVYKAQVNGITCYFIEDALFNVGFNKDGKPNNIYEGTDLDVKRRWAHFQRLSADLVYKLSKKEKNPVQLVHVHDAQTALVPKILLTRHYKEWKEGNTPATVFTFHNNNCPISFDYPKALDALQEIGLPHSSINSFVEGLESSDMNTTVSETFAKEVQTDEFGKGMQRYTKINAFNGKIAGIVNGNTDGWNPKTDAQLKNWVTKEGVQLDLSYGPEDEDLPQKIKLIREQLVDYLNIHNLGDFDPTKPIFFYVGRYDAYQKGIDKLPIIMDEALKQGAQFICIGLEPDEKADRILKEMEFMAQGQKGVAIIRDFKRPDGRLYWQQGNVSLQDTTGVPGFGSLLRAAIDVGIFPSIFEPCGLVQGEMHRMGIETAATGTGGFMDTIFTFGPHRNGYLFPRLPEWGSELQNIEIRITVKMATARNQKKLDALYSDDQTQLAPFIEQKRTIMRNAANSSWTSTFDGSLPPIERVKLSYAKAGKNKEKRGIIHLDVHGLKM